MYIEQPNRSASYLYENTNRTQPPIFASRAEAAYYPRNSFPFGEVPPSDMLNNVYQPDGLKREVYLDDLNQFGESNMTWTTPSTQARFSAAAETFSRLKNSSNQSAFVNGIVYEVHKISLLELFVQIS